MKAPISSEKHYVQNTTFTVTAAAVNNLTLLEGVKLLSKNAAWEVEEGAVVKAVYLEYWITSDDATQGSVVATLEKTSTNSVALTYADSIALYDYDNKKNCLYTTQGLTPPNVQSGIPFLRGWFKIPKGKQRMGYGDKLVLNISAITNGANVCGFCTFKEYK